MAGKRRESGKPLLRQLKEVRRQATLAARLRAASTPGKRVAVAIDHARAELGPNASEQAVNSLVMELTSAGDQIYLARRHAVLDVELAAAATGRDQVAVAARYVRAALGSDPGAKAVELTDQLVRTLVKGGH